MSEQELTALIVTAQSYCLNADPAHPYSNLNVGDETLYLKSDTDEQLLIHIVFQTAVRLSGISFRGPIDSTAPSSMKLYCNLTSPGFTDIEDTEVVQTLELSTDDIAQGKKLTLRQVKFQNVVSFTIFVHANKGADYTTLSALKIYGFTLDGLDVGTIHQRSHTH
jgi:hypothetical protein